MTPWLNARQIAIVLVVAAAAAGCSASAPARFYTLDSTTAGEAALVEAVWTVRRTADGETRLGRTLAREAVQGEDFDALALAHSRALATVSGDIATVIRAEASEDQ